MVVLDRVSQNYNIGAIFRLCDAFLVQQLVICGTKVDLRKRRFVQAAQGTQGWVPWSDYQNASQAIADAKARGAWVVVAEQITDSVHPEQLVPKFPACLVLGGERSGVSPEAIAVTDAAVAIPMLGMANSLNVATTAAILLYWLPAVLRNSPETRFCAPGTCCCLRPSSATWDAATVSRPHARRQKKATIMPKYFNAELSRWNSVGRGDAQTALHFMPLIIAPTSALECTKPAVGIFWRVGGALVIDRSTLDQAEPYGDCLTHATGHYERWQQWQALGPARLACKGFPAQIAWTEYDDWPRGRVVYERPKQHFVLYADRRLQKPAIVDVLNGAFGLNVAELKVIVRSDSHYRST
jgi:tRNA(Leu) C34 or U34 (ribose-2'-O)-methylase TrmL